MPIFFNPLPVPRARPYDYTLKVARVMQTSNRHTYQVFTKRSERMRDMLQTSLAEAAGQPHIWWGMSVENRRQGCSASTIFGRLRQRSASSPSSHFSKT